LSRIKNTPQQNYNTRARVRRETGQTPLEKIFHEKEKNERGNRVGEGLSLRMKGLWKRKNKKSCSSERMAIGGSIGKGVQAERRKKEKK